MKFNKIGQDGETAYEVSVDGEHLGVVEKDIIRPKVMSGRILVGHTETRCWRAIGSGYTVTTGFATRQDAADWLYYKAMARDES